jgi:hypothetical protein
MRTAKVFLVALSLLSIARFVTASVRDVQIYGIVERVVFEPNEKAPERIKVYGAFAFLYTNQEPVSSNAGPYAPHKGYLYFKLPPVSREDSQELTQATAKREWADLKAVAGAGQAIMFGAWSSGWLGLASGSRTDSGFVSARNTKEALRVYSEKERGTDPITYTMDTGIVKMPSHGKFARLHTQLQETLKQ